MGPSTEPWGTPYLTLTHLDPESPRCIQYMYAGTHTNIYTDTKQIMLLYSVFENSHIIRNTLPIRQIFAVTARDMSNNFPF